MKNLTIALLVLSTVLFSQDILFEDDFSDGTPDGWMPLFGEGTYFVNSSYRYDISYTGPNHVTPAVVRGDSLNIFMSVNDYSVLLEAICHAPSHYVGIYSRGTLAHTGYGLWLRYDVNEIHIFRHDGPSNWTSIGEIAFALTYDEHYWIRFECEGGTQRAKAWQDPDPEPSEWILTVFDYTWDDYGFTGFVTGQYEEGDSHAEFDNVEVTTITSALDQSTWCQIKASF